MNSGCCFEKYILNGLKWYVGALLIFAIGCGGGSVSPNSGSPNPTTSGANPGTSSGANPGSSGASNSGSGSSGSTAAGFLYVGLDDGYSLWSNIAHTGHASIAGFAVSSDGTLQATSGSPYAGPATALAADSAASTLYAASGSTLNVNRINGDGSLMTTLTLNSQPLTPSIGIYQDLSFNAQTQFLYALAIHGAGDNFFEIYKAGGDGALSNAGSQQVSVAAAHPSFTPDGGRAYQTFCYHLDGEIFGYTSGADGKLTAFNTKALVSNLGTPHPACPFALSITADGSRLVAQLNAVTGGTAALAVYAINPDGTLTEQGSSLPTTAQGSDIAWDPSGRYAAVAAKDGLWLYNLTGSSAVPVGGAPLVSGPMDHLAFNKAGTLLFATSASGQTVYVFAFNSSSGTAVPAPGSPHKVSLPPYALTLSER